MVTPIKPLFARHIVSVDSNEEEALFVVDPDLGALGKIDVRTGFFYGIVNFRSVNAFKGSAALCMRPDGIVNYSRSNRIYAVGIEDGTVRDAMDIITIDQAGELVGLCWKNDRYYAVDRRGALFILDEDGLIQAAEVGHGANDITLHGDRLFILNGASQAIYIYSLDGIHLASLTIPYEGASGIASIKTLDKEEPGIYIYYNQDSWDVFDDASSESGKRGSPSIKLNDHVSDGFIERLDYKIIELGEMGNFGLSTGYEVKLTYAEMLKPAREVLNRIGGVEMCVRLSIPVETRRQKIKSIRIIGDVPGVLKKDENGNEIVEFDLTGVELDKERRSFGYSAVIEVYGIRYKLNVTDAPYPDDIKTRFLKEESRYDMDRLELKDIAAELISALPENERGNVVKIAKAVREYVYSRLAYRYNNQYTSPVETLRGGEGTCGKYMELLIGLMRLCGVACRPVGDFKVPEYKLRYARVNSVCTPDYDHAWVEFYVPGLGWVPMESSSDNAPERHERFFGALSWIYIENSRTEKMCEIGKPGCWEQVDNDPMYSDLFVPDIQIEVLREASLDEVFPD
ncbi:transglutaminase-like domain-containing protein [Paraburkholderia sp. SIMBA_030]|uniref:transglutaminase-like domain-containing protein n=1 Tax=Paraburkholderia sp. SIMBA_030 TaxID=3085773 RepID=UPI00397D3F30